MVYLNRIDQQQEAVPRRPTDRQWTVSPRPRSTGAVCARRKALTLFRWNLIFTNVSLRDLRFYLYTLLDFDQKLKYYYVSYTYSYSRINDTLQITTKRVTDAHLLFFFWHFVTFIASVRISDLQYLSKRIARWQAAQASMKEHLQHNFKWVAFH